MSDLSYAALAQVVGSRRGIYDVPCPACGPDRRSAANRRRKVLRVWCDSPDFLTYSCARCGAHGFARPSGSERLVSIRRPPAAPLSKTTVPRTDAAKRDKAQWLWTRRRPIIGSPAEIYLRRARRYSGPMPSTLAFLPVCGEHPPAMIAAFGLAEEIEPGVISIPSSKVAGVHLTRIASDGLDKAGTETDKIMLGAPLGSPIVLAPPNDLGGLAITEGIEDALSVHEATGLGAWAAGAASFLPALAAAVPEWVEWVTLLVDDDYAGRTNSDALADRLEARGFPVRLVFPAHAMEACP
jgi:hypothetical protein